MNRHTIKMFLMTIIISLGGFANEKLNIVTTIPDFADFARNIGGDRVSVTSLMRGDQDPHAVEPRPSMVMQVKKADVLIRVGMDLDLWVESLIDASRNPKVMKEARGYLDASQKITKLEVPEGKIDGSMGDIHIYGNPHYWTDPENIASILDQILSRLCELRSADAEYFKQNHKNYSERLGIAMQKWKELLQPYAGTAIVTYHNSWPYFVRCFGLSIAGFVEPKPGIPPTPAHIAALVDKMKVSKTKVIIMEPYFNLKTAQSIAAKAGAKVVILSPSVGGVKGTDSYIDLFEYNVNHLADALRN